MSDYIIRAMAAGGQIRAFAATTKDLVEHARQIHNTSPVATAGFSKFANILHTAMSFRILKDF